MGIYDEIYSEKLCTLAEKYPVCMDFLRSRGLKDLDKDMLLADAVDALRTRRPEASLPEGFEAAGELASLIESMEKDRGESVERIEILGGSDKAGERENADIIIEKGRLISIVGPTGAGKSQLLEDIECAALGDTPTGRRVLFNGRELDDEERCRFSGRLVAQLTQNMNFVLDVSVEKFLAIHAHSRGLADGGERAERCFETANELSGESFSRDTKLTRLSGGQARALMIADAACISPSPVLLIDEIENAGIDRLKAVELLSGGDKIVLLATHDPLLALTASKRIVLSGGGIRAVLEKSDEEQRTLQRLIEADRLNTKLRNEIRSGRRV